MSENKKQNSKRKKIVARNLTAKAAERVVGNPANSRTESAMDNSYPGLELDARNLERKFFPGLEFEFHRSDGAVLCSSENLLYFGLEDSDLPLYIWAICGKFTKAQQIEERSIVYLFGNHSGLDVWRRIHDFLPGTISIALGPKPGWTMQYEIRSRLLELNELGSVIERNAKGEIELVILTDKRTKYLNENGVIDPEVYKAGDLTRTLCAPWQYDFRDCGCFYWAASKPDIVSSSDGSQPYLNYQRKDRSTPSKPDITDYTDPEAYTRRRMLEIDSPELISGRWKDLPIVISDSEVDSIITKIPKHSKQKQLFSKAEAVKELSYLATVEHALCIEYLFAHYSLNAPPHPNFMEQRSFPEGTTNAEKEKIKKMRKIASAADEVLQIAIDEMRHLRWVNEALNLLGGAASVDRANQIGWLATSSQKRKQTREFKLERLTRDQLKWFIDVEKPSQAVDEKDSLDGMYIRLITSFANHRDFKDFEHTSNLIDLMKLIIDEGGEHFRRFTKIEKSLAGMKEKDYLRSFDEKPDKESKVLIDYANENYWSLMVALEACFRIGDRHGGKLLQQARRLMYNLHEVCHKLGNLNIAPNFNWPPTEYSSKSLSEKLDDRLEGFLVAAASGIENSDEKNMLMISRQQTEMQNLYTALRDAVQNIE